MHTADRTGRGLKPLVVAVTIAAVLLLASVLVVSALSLRVRLATAKVALPLVSSPCIASRTTGDEGHGEAADARERVAFVAATRGCMMTTHTAMLKTFDAPRSADALFAAAMVPHHQGAVDMARQLLVHGRDPELRALALGVIAEQQTEIEMLRIWSARHDHVGAAASVAVNRAAYPNDDRR